MQPSSQPIESATPANVPPTPGDSARRPSLLQGLRRTAQVFSFPNDHLVLLAACLLANGLRLHIRGLVTDAVFGAVVALLGLSLFREGGFFGAARHGPDRSGRSVNGKLLLTPLCFAALLALYGIGLAFEPSGQGLRNLTGIFCLAVVFLFCYQNGLALAQSPSAILLFSAAMLAALLLYRTSVEIHPLLLSVYMGYSLLIIGISSMVRCKSKLAQHFWAHAALLAAAAGALVFGTRSQVLAMLLAYPFYWGAWHLLRSRRGAGALAGCVLALICLITFLLGNDRTNEVLRNLKHFGWSYTGNDLHTGRDVLIRSSLSGMLEAPWFGKGPAADATRLAGNGSPLFGPEDLYCLKWANPGLLADCNALLKARNALAGTDRNLLWNWDFDRPIGSWLGVALAGAPPRIVRLDLSDMALTGQIPAALGELDELTVLHLGGNHLTGPIPSEIGRMSKLTILHLSNNALTGSIPEELGNLANLEELRLERNRLSGNIPETLAALEKLRRLKLRGNDFASDAPLQLYRIADHDLHENLFCVPPLRLHPELLRDCAVLLEMRDALAGSAEVLNWRHNVALHNWMGVRLSEPPVRVIALHLSQVGLGGQIPAQIAALDALADLRLDGNHLRGEISAELGELRNLRILRLADNSFHGPTPAILRKIKNHDLNSDLYCLPGPRMTPGLLADCTALLAAPHALAGADWLNWRKSVPIGIWQGVVLDNDPPRVVRLQLAGTELGERVPAALERLKRFADRKMEGGNDLDSGASVALSEFEGRDDRPDIRFCPRSPRADSGLAADCNLLLSIKDVLDSHGALNWHRSLPIAAWRGVRLGSDPMRVEKLRLIGLKLSGRIPPELGRLSGLRTLRLSNASLTGSIPPELGNLKHLEILHLGKNRLGGFVPPEISALPLHKLILERNEFIGPVHSVEDSLLARDGPLASAIPPEMRQAADIELAPSTSCRQLSNGNPGLQEDCDLLLAARDQLSGSAKLNWTPSTPIHFWQGVVLGGTPMRVIALDLSRRAIDGAIPAGLGNLEELVSLRLHRNALTGPIPPELGKLARLQELLLGNNALTGSLPKELGNLSQLTALHLRRNQLQGPIPSELGELVNLRTLALDGNALTGPMPAELGKLLNLEELRLGRKQRSHALPAEVLALLPKLSFLWFDSSQASPVVAEQQFIAGAEGMAGASPALEGGEAMASELFCVSGREIGPLLKDCRSLLVMRDEWAGGASLNWSPSVPIGAWQGVKVSGQPARITGLELPHMNLRGRLPTILERLDELISLRLEGNQLAGTIPQQLLKLKDLRILRLGGNSFSGCLPEALRNSVDRSTELDLRCDSSPWRKPPLFNDAAVLMSARDALAGDAQLNWSYDSPISAWEGVAVSGRPGRVAALDLSRRGLNGRIPAQLGTLDGLVDLRLSDNRLTGPIPPELEKLAGLRSLRLDGNTLAGPLPSWLENLRGLKDLRLDGSVLSGCLNRYQDRLNRAILPLQLPFCGADWLDDLTPMGRAIYLMNELVDLAPGAHLAESSHNLFLQIGLQSGLLGLGAAMLLCLSLIFNLRRQGEAETTPVQCFTAACVFTAIFLSAFEIFLLQHFLSAAIFAWAAIGIGTGAVRATPPSALSPSKSALR